MCTEANTQMHVHAGCPHMDCMVDALCVHIHAHKHFTSSSLCTSTNQAQRFCDSHPTPRF